MTRLVMVLVVAEILVAAAAVRLGSAASESAAATAGLGVAVMAAVAVPSLGALLWGRMQANAAFLTSVVAVILLKMAVVGGALAYVWIRTSLPRLEFALGLVGGWVASFIAQAVVLVKTQKPAPGTGAAQSLSGLGREEAQE